MTNNVCKLIDRLRFGSLQETMIVLTPAEAGEIYRHMEHLATKAADREAKFISMCDHTYELVKINRDLKRQLGEL